VNYKAEQAYLNASRRFARDREGYILSCALHGAQERLRLSLKSDDFWPTPASAMEIGLHRGLIFYLLEQG
jgi:hypothetical protein